MVHGSFKLKRMYNLQQRKKYVSNLLAIAGSSGTLNKML